MAKNYYRSPGPKYNAPTTVGYEKTDLRLPRAPAYSLGRLLRPKQTSFRVPGPKYDVSNTTRHGLITMAGVSIASKLRRQHTTRTPGPAAYNTVQCMPVIKPAVPMYSIGWVRIYKHMYICICTTSSVVTAVVECHMKYSRVRTNRIKKNIYIFVRNHARENSSIRTNFKVLVYLLFRFFNKKNPLSYATYCDTCAVHFNKYRYIRIVSKDDILSESRPR